MTGTRVKETLSILTYQIKFLIDQLKLQVGELRRSYFRNLERDSKTLHE